MKYALIGCGRISPNHIAAARDNKLEITALCDINLNNLNDKFKAYNLTEQTKKYECYKELLEKEQPEIVAVATESGKHAKIAMDCIEAGCHVIIEKPIALSLEDADSIIAQAKKKGVKVSTCHQNRFNKSIQKIREAINQERFGRLLYGTAHIRWNRGYDYYSCAKWRGTWEMDGGALMNQCIHNIDLLRWMMGNDVTEVVGLTDNLKHEYLEAEDFGAAMIKFANGSYGIIEGTTVIFPENLEETLYIFGEKGTAKAGGKSVNRIEEWRFEDSIESADEIKKLYQEEPPNVYGFGHRSLYTDMIAAVCEDREPYVSAEDGRRALELVLAIYKSQKEGKVVKLPLNHFSTLDMKE